MQAGAKAELKWEHIPTSLQEPVQQWFLLFCFELCELGYWVRQDSRRLPYKDEVIQTYSLNIAG